MNIQASIPDFGYQEFILVEAPADVVAQAVAAYVARSDAMMTEAMTRKWRMPFVFRPIYSVVFAIIMIKQFTRTVLSRDFSRAPDPELPEPYTVFRGRDAAGPPLTRPYTPFFRVPGSDDAGPERCEDIRVSSVMAHPDLTLVEFCERVSGMSFMAHGLSEELKGRDLLYFRRSGPSALEKTYDFHVCRDGLLKRRVLCHAMHPEADPAQERWEGISDYPQSRYEPEGLYDETTAETLLDNRKIDMILGSFRLDAAALFAPGAAADPVLFARRPDGEPLAA